MTRSRIAIAVLLVIALAVPASCGAGYLYFARPWVRPPAGPSEQAGVVKVIVHSAELASQDTVRVTLTVQNLRPFWEADGEFYVDEFWLEDSDGEQMDEDYEIMWAEGQPDYVAAGSFETLVVVFHGVAGTPAVIGYDAWETCGKEIYVPLPTVKRASTKV